eukprot:gene15662-biopygen12747
MRASPQAPHKGENEVNAAPQAPPRENVTEFCGVAGAAEGENMRCCRHRRARPPADRMSLVPFGGYSRSGAKRTNVPFVDSDGLPNTPDPATHAGRSPP